MGGKSKAEGSASEKKGRFLVVEDDENLRKMTSRMLESIAEEVVAVGNGEEALDQLRSDPNFDLVVTDVMMPRMDGFTLAKQLKATPGLDTVPVVMLTARTGPRDVIAGINAGARFYVTKPFKTEELVSKVRKALGVKHAR